MINLPSSQIYRQAKLLFSPEKSSDYHRAPKSRYTCLIHHCEQLFPNVHDPYFLHCSPLIFFDIYSKNVKNRRNTMSKMSKMSIAPPPPPPNYNTSKHTCDNKANGSSKRFGSDKTASSCNRNITALSEKGHGCDDAKPSGHGYQELSYNWYHD